MCYLSGFFFLVKEESPERNSFNFDDLESDTWNITLGVALSTEASNYYFVVFVDEVQAAVVGDEGSYLLAVLLEEYTDALSDGGVRLLSFNTHLFNYDTLCHGCSLQRFLVFISLMGLLVLLISPSLGPPP